MSGEPSLRIPRKSFVAVVLTIVFLMILTAWGTIALSNRGVNDDYAWYITRIVTLPILTLLVWVIVRDHKTFLSNLFARSGLTPKLIISGVLVGLLARILWWAEITARASFGWMQQSGIGEPQSLMLGYSCPGWQLFATAVLVWSVLIPISEEFINRGIILSSIAHRGPFFAILGSAVIFTLMHPPDSYVWVFLFGIVFGVQFWNVRTLWASIATHATYDGAQIFDWICLKIIWAPANEDIPLVVPGIVSTIIAAACCVGIAFLISKRWVGTPAGTRPS